MGKKTEIELNESAVRVRRIAESLSKFNKCEEELDSAGGVTEPAEDEMDDKEKELNSGVNESVSRARKAFRKLSRG